MDCSCNFETDSDAGAGVNFEPFRVKKSRKTHICGECGVKISVGDTYLKNSGIWNGKFFRYKICVTCESVRVVFFTNGSALGGLWEDFHNNLEEFEGSLPEKCLAELLPEARALVCGILERYWEDEAESLQYEEEDTK